MDKMLFCLVQDNMFRLTFDVVAQDRFKSIDMVLPSAFFKMNETLHRAVRCCVSDVVSPTKNPISILQNSQISSTRSSQSTTAET